MTYQEIESKNENLQSIEKWSDDDVIAEKKRFEEKKQREFFVRRNPQYKKASLEDINLAIAVEKYNIMIAAAPYDVNKDAIAWAKDHDIKIGSQRFLDILWWTDNETLGGNPGCPICFCDGLIYLGINSDGLIIGSYNCSEEPLACYFNAIGTYRLFSVLKTRNDYCAVFISENKQKQFVLNSNMKMVRMKTLEELYKRRNELILENSDIDWSNEYLEFCENE